MGDSKFCTNCGAKTQPEDVFCESCGHKLEADDYEHEPEVKEERSAYQKQEDNIVPPARQAAREPFREPFPDRPKKKGNSGVIAVVALLVIVIFGGSYWFFSQKGENDNIAEQPNQNADSSNQNSQTSNEGTGETQQTGSTSSQLDLTKARTYLSTPGYKSTFFVNYPDGMAGVVERFSGRGPNANEGVIVSEVEVVRENGEDYGYGFHYVTRQDGSYYILDSTPFEIYPHLKDDLSIGKTWSYEDEVFGDIVWTVMDMGVDLDLGFEKFSNCLVVKEDNQAAGFVTIAYYAPGSGMIYSTDASGNNDYYKMTAKEQIGIEQAESQIVKWCPNYLEIKDDRTQ